VSRSSFAKLAVRFTFLGVLVFVLSAMSNPTSVRAAASCEQCFTDLHECKAICATLPAASQESCIVACTVRYDACIEDC
jgi:hypothetical protein